VSASLADAQAWLQREYPQVASGFLTAAPEAEPSLLAIAERVYASLVRKCDEAAGQLTEALEGSCA
jgi:hypothetical protein